MKPLSQKCQLCRDGGKGKKLLPAAVLRASLTDEIRRSHPSWDETGFICQNHLNQFRKSYIESVLSQEVGELSSIEYKVIEALRDHQLLSENLNTEHQEIQTFGNRISDRVTTFIGSWKFIISFILVIITWIAVNAAFLWWRPYDPYPFILLNLTLSCLAALQAPLIMMSQNHQQSKDRLRSELDYRVDLKSEIEIRQLHEKIDHLLKYQWARIAELQETQLEILNELQGNSSDSTDA